MTAAEFEMLGERANPRKLAGDWMTTAVAQNATGVAWRNFGKWKLLEARNDTKLTLRNRSLHFTPFLNPVPVELGCPLPSLL